jgi:GNAT superfamily N-acetyltransferase
MKTPVLTHDLAGRIEQALASASLARLAGIQHLEGNPLGIEVRQFGHVIARLVRRDLAYYPYFNGPVDLRAEDEALIVDIAAWYRENQRPCYIRLSPFFAGEPLLARMAGCGLRQSGFMSVLYGEIESAGAEQPSPPAGIAIAVDQAFAHFPHLWTAGAPASVGPTELSLRKRLARAEFSQWRPYLAFVDGKPAALASLYLAAGAAILAGATTLPEFRGRGCQTALLRRRLADAAAAGCTLAVAEASPGSTSQRNMERSGLRTAYTKAIWLNRVP